MFLINTKFCNKKKNWKRKKRTFSFKRRKFKYWIKYKIKPKFKLPYTILPYFFIINNFKYKVLFQIKKVIKSRRVFTVRKKKRYFAFNKIEKNWNKYKIARYAIHKHNLWFMAPIDCKRKFIKKKWLNNKKKQRVQKKKLKYFKKLMIKNKIAKLFWIWKKKKFKQTLEIKYKLKKYFSTIRLLKVLSTHIRLPKKYVSFKYKKKRFRRKYIVNLKKMKFYKSIKYLKYHAKQRPLNQLKKLNKIFFWMSEIPKNKIMSINI